MLFKINGERNSGTNFLFNLLKLNGYNVFEQEIKNNICYYWKHGVPHNSIKNKDELVVDIFIFRDLEKWLISSWKNPYHLYKIKDLHNFLTKKQYSNEKKLKDFRTHKQLNANDNNKTIFQIRYYKFNKIIEYKNKNKNIILVNLDFIQNKKNCQKFLVTLHNHYFNYPKNDFIYELENHTKSKNINDKNRYENLSINLQKYSYQINEDIENYINSLTFEIY